jgi:nucleoside-triphosphatase THEP1
VVRKVVERLGSVAGGFLTEDIREGGRRVGFWVRDVSTGEEGLLAHASLPGRPRVGKYGVDLESFEEIGVAALEAALHRPGCIVIDEIGKMELASDEFRAAVLAALDSDHPVVATVPAYRLPFVVACQKRPDTRVVEVTAANRDSLPERLVGMLSRAGGSPA